MLWYIRLPVLPKLVIAVVAVVGCVLLNEWEIGLRSYVGHVQFLEWSLVLRDVAGMLGHKVFVQDMV